MWWYLKSFVLIEIMQRGLSALWLWSHAIVFVLVMCSLFLAMNFIVFFTEHMCVSSDPVSNLNLFLVSRKAERYGEHFAGPLWHERWQLQSCSRSKYWLLFHLIPTLIFGWIRSLEYNIISSWKSSVRRSQSVWWKDSKNQPDTLFCVQNLWIQEGRGVDRGVNAREHFFFWFSYRQY